MLECTTTLINVATTQRRLHKTNAPLDLGLSVVRVDLGERVEGRHCRAGALRVRVVDHDVSEGLRGVQGLIPVRGVRE